MTELILTPAQRRQKEADDLVCGAYTTLRRKFPDAAPTALMQLIAERGVRYVLPEASEITASRCPTTRNGISAALERCGLYTPKSEKSQNFKTKQ